MNAVRFEKLLEEYMYGDMTTNEYRKERAKLVQELIISLNKIERPSTIEVNLDNNQTRIRGNKPAFQVPTIKKQPSGIFNAIWKVLLIGVLIATAVISWYFSTTGINEISNDKKIILESNKDEIKQQSTIKDEPFILAFIQNNSWNTESISNFLVQWQSLSRTQQSLARQSDSFSELSNILQEKIQQQRKINNKPTTREENLLIWFASQLSIGLN